MKVIGAGPTGSLLGLGLASVGSKVHIIDIKSEQELIKDPKAYAITHSTRKLLEKLDLWSDLSSFLSPFSELRLEDREIMQSLTFSCKDLTTSNKTTKAIGWILEHEDLMNVLYKKIKQQKSITCEFNKSYCFDSDSSQLLFGADGSNSNFRKSLKILNFKYNYNQVCLATKVIIRSRSSFTAYEVFREEGPLAILPLGSDLYQVIWSAPKPACIKRLNLTESMFLNQLAAVLPEGLEPDQLISRPSIFPVKIAFALSLYKGQKILVGESAHCLHPVGGQGLNLSLRDVNDIIYLMKKVNRGHLSKYLLPFLYFKNRFIDIISVGIFTHLLVLLFSNRNPIKLWIRKPLIYLISNLSLVRKITISFMTDGPRIFINDKP